MKYYEVYDRQTGDMLARGTAWECKQVLGCASIDSFYALANRSRRGINKKYEVKILNGGDTDYPLLGKNDPIHELGVMPTYDRKKEGGVL